ncbi:MAG: metal-dependent transcriptional regulator [Oscillospiraceae bacterium]|nr:metal-dependent transcriptional regulator [Oscillospiraceae bacterium]
MNIPESAENYLETIYVLSRDGAPVRAIDVANALGFSKPSVSIALKNLRESKHVTVDSGHILLTASGRAVAESVHERHVVISGWLIAMGVEPNIAHADACKIEHVLSEQSFAAIKQYLEEHRSCKH